MNTSSDEDVVASVLTTFAICLPFKKFKRQAKPLPATQNTQYRRIGNCF